MYFGSTKIFAIGNNITVDSIKLNDAQNYVKEGKNNNNNNNVKIKLKYIEIVFI
jgi:hypothetical protein